MLPVLASLALTIGLLLLMVRLLRRLTPGALRRTGGVPLTLLQRIPVGPRQSVSVVRVAERVTYHRNHYDAVRRAVQQALAEQCNYIVLFQPLFQVAARRTITDVDLTAIGGVIEMGDVKPAA